MVLGQLTNEQIGFAVADGFWLVVCLTIKLMPYLITFALLRWGVRGRFRKGV